MNPWFWLARIGAALLTIALTLVLWSLLSPTGALRKQAQRYLAHLRRELDFLHADVSPLSLALTQLGALILALGCACLQGWVPALLGIVGTGAPLLVLRVQREKRIALIDQQVESWLVALGNALKASPSLGEALNSTLNLMRDPIASEIDRIVKEHQLGTPLDHAFTHAAARVGSRSFAMALTTLRIARNTGGDLPETLATSAKSLREMARLDGVVRTKTAEGKAQALVVSCIPVPLYFMIGWLHPGFFDPLKHTLTGQLIIGLAATLWLGAALLAQRILKVDI